MGFPSPLTKFNYVPLSLSAGAWSNVSYGDYPPRFSGSIEVVVTVSNADGSLRTDLSAHDFKVQMFSSAEYPAATKFELLEGPSATSDAYLLAVFAKSGEWVNGIHVIVVEVSKVLGRYVITENVAAGRTVTTAEVSFQV